MRPFVTRIAVAVALAGAFAAYETARVESRVQGQKPDQTSTKETSRGKASEDKNIKEAEGVNTRGQASSLPGPAEKTGEKTRQALCAVMFDNYTNLFVQTYVDGRYAGVMRPWGELHTYAVAGPTVLYARAVYTDGSYDSWGPVRVSCNTSYRWQLK